MNPSEILPFLVENGIQWVESQREAYHAKARKLTNEEKDVLQIFFPAQTLETARVKIVPVIENPDFYYFFQEMNIPKLLDFSSAVGMTFRDTIVFSQRFLSSHSVLRSFLFHELVHVVQYEVLGVAGFIERYARGWVENGFDYYAIPLEVDAYNLEKRFAAHPDQGFSVLDALLSRLNETS